MSDIEDNLADGLARLQPPSAGRDDGDEEENEGVQIAVAVEGEAYANQEQLDDIYFQHPTIGRYARERLRRIRRNHAQLDRLGLLNPPPQQNEQPPPQPRQPRRQQQQPRDPPRRNPTRQGRRPNDEAVDIDEQPMRSRRRVGQVDPPPQPAAPIAVGPPPPPPAPIAAPGGRVVANIPPVPPPVMIANPPVANIPNARLPYHRFTVAEQVEFQSEYDNDINMAWANLHDGRGGLTRFLMTSIIKRWHYCRGKGINHLSEENRNAFDPNQTLSVLLHEMIRNGGIEGHLVRGCAGYDESLAEVCYDVLFIDIILLNKC